MLLSQVPSSSGVDDFDAQVKPGALNSGPSRSHTEAMILNDPELQKNTRRLKACLRVRSIASAAEAAFSKVSIQEVNASSPERRAPDSGVLSVSPLSLRTPSGETDSVIAEPVAGEFLVPSSRGPCFVLVLARKTSTLLRMVKSPRGARRNPSSASHEAQAAGIVAPSAASAGEGCMTNKRDLEDGIEGCHPVSACGSAAPVAATELTLDDGGEAGRVRPDFLSHNSSNSGNSVHSRIRGHSVLSSACARAYDDHAACIALASCLHAGGSQLNGARYSGCTGGLLLVQEVHQLLPRRM